MNKSSLCKLLALVMCVTALYVPASADEIEDTADMQVIEASEPTDAVIEEAEEEGEIFGEAEAEVAAEDQGIEISRGTIFTYNDTLYKVKEEETNVNKINNGDFETNAYMTEADPNDGRAFDKWVCGKSTVSQEAARHGESGLSVPGSTTLIYRTNLDSTKTYVYSAWYKFPMEDDCKLDEGYRHIVCGAGVTVGYNEIGRGTAKTGGWQQVLIVFQPSGDCNFSNYLRYNGSQPLLVDDAAIYEVTEIDEPISIVTTPEPSYYEETGDEFYPENGFFTQRGEITHTARVKNENDEDAILISVAAVFRNNQLVKIYSKPNVVIRAGRYRDVEVSLDVPQEGDIEEYSYKIFFIDSLTSLQMIGGPSALNPTVVAGKSE